MTRPRATPPPLPVIEGDVERMLEEDLGSGDLTALLLPVDCRARASLISREEALLCGRSWVDLLFQRIDPAVRLEWHADDGDRLVADQPFLTLTGPARPIVSGERSALNLLQTLSATATATARHVALLQGSGCTLLDTRKTLPGLRQAQKYAVRVGGGSNHRMGLYDAILIKENHILAAGSVVAAVAAATAIAAGRPVECEIERLEQIEAAIAAGATSLLLDNFSPAELRQAVATAAGRVPLEASGGITAANLRQVADCGVDYISLGTLTKDLQAIDLSLRLDLEPM